MIQTEDKQVGILLLAAGASSRMGTIKQLLPYLGKPMLRYVADQIWDPKMPLLVVLGAHADQISNCLQGAYAYTINRDWESGMGGSISHGLSVLLHQYNKLQGVIILAADQPFIDKKVINHMIYLSDKHNAGIVSYTYENGPGIPVFFADTYFSDLLRLEGPSGAKKVLITHQDKIVTFESNNLYFDIDTPESYQTLLKL